MEEHLICGYTLCYCLFVINTKYLFQQMLKISGDLALDEQTLKKPLKSSKALQVSCSTIRRDTG